MVIAIITALEQEFKSVKSQINNTEDIASIYKIVTGNIKSHKVYLAFSSPGKVSASALTQHLIDRFSPNLTISLGISGGISEKLQVGDVLFSNQYTQYDYNLGFSKKGENWNPAYDSEVLMTTVPEIAKPLCSSLFGTGDSFIYKDDDKERLRGMGIDACDMESGAVAQISYLNNVDNLSIRGISDLGTGTPKEFKKNMKLSIDNSMLKLKDFLGQLC